MSFLGELLYAPSRYHLRDLIHEIFIMGTYDVGSLPDNPVIVDVGANIDIATFFFVHRYAPSRLLAFEPDPDAFSMLRRNITRNGWDRVECHNMALAEKAGQMDLFYDAEHPASLHTSGVMARMPKQSRLVQCQPLSTLLPQQVDLLKLDIEGMEWEVFDDLVSTGSMTSIDRMIIEYHHHLPLNDDRLSRFLSPLEEAGFGYKIDADYVPGSNQKSYQDVLIYAYKKT